VTNTMEAISASKEIYHPSAEIVAAANVPDYLELRPRAVEDPVAFWDARAKEIIDWYEPYTTALDSSKAPFFKWFVAARPISYTTRWIATSRAGAKTSWRCCGKARNGEQRTYSYFKLWKEGQPLRQCAQGDGRQEGRHRHHLHGARARTADRHARHRQDRRHPQRCLRRLLRAGAGRPHHRRAQQSRRHLPATAPGCAARPSTSRASPTRP
jgi:hypothetical protein